MTRKPSTRYDALSILLHWLTAIAVGAAFILGPEGFGRLMRDGIDPATRSGIVWHESLGLLIFAMTLMRLVWVTMRPARPQIPQAAWMHRAAQFMHLLLWTLLLALPLSALLALGSEDHPLTVLGGWRVDHLPLIAGSALGQLADWGEVHQFLGDTIVWLAGLHAAAAIFHHFVLKDGVLLTMLPRGRSR